MSSRRAQSLPPAAYEKQLQLEQPAPRSKCMSFVCFSWKVFTCIFSHVTLVTLVVAYCVLGAFTFEHLEAENERSVKRGISSIRGNVTEQIWEMTSGSKVLYQQNWTASVVEKLQMFESDILAAMKTKGWDGDEDEKSIQWTFSGALFYSIIVITTIGYGHIAPKTQMGKVSTIFYAILGIPLMLLCLSNIGDIMASSFRFLYWRVCCFVCTRETKKSKLNRRSRGGTIRQQQQQQQQQGAFVPASGGRHSGRLHPASSSLRRSVRTSQRSADSGFDTYYDTGLSHAYSDNDCNRFPVSGGPQQQMRTEQQLYYDDREKNRGGQSSSQRSNRSQQGPPPASPRYPRGGSDRVYRQERHTVDRERFPVKYNEPDEYHENAEDFPPQNARRNGNGPLTPIQQRHMMRNAEDQQNMGGSLQHQNRMPTRASLRVQSLDRRQMRRDPVMIDFEHEPPTKTPVICNKYAMDDVEEREMGSKRSPNARSQSMPRQIRYGDRLLPPGQSDRLPIYEDNDLEMQPIRKGRKPRERQVPSPSPRIMSPMGFAVHRQARHVADETSLYDDEWESSGDQAIRPVPIWLCVFLVVSYIIGGAFLFSKWEKWDFLDSAYFCFITLTTIGFGDFVPAQGVKENSEVSIALCSLYLLFGIALLAMSFNLVQEEVISNVKSVAKRLGIIKNDEIEE